MKFKSLAKKATLLLVLWNAYYLYILIYKIKSINEIKFIIYIYIIIENKLNLIIVIKYKKNINL